MIGRTISHYRILERLGAGGMGEVYLAEDTNLGRKVAFKVVSPQMAADPAARARLVRPNVDRDSSEGPDVAEQQQERQRHDHRLGHQPGQRESAQREVSGTCGLRGIRRVRAQCEQQKQRAQHVLPLRDPGHGLDVQRVHGEERRGAGAARGRWASGDSRRALTLSRR
jgi:serine/threonine protein kinase